MTSDATTPTASEPSPQDHLPTEDQAAPTDRPQQTGASNPGGLPHWSPDDYPELVGDGAEKLASSAVAPVVAAGRGYRSVTPVNLRAEKSRLGLTPQNRQLSRLVGNTSALLIPWYRLGSRSSVRGSGVVPVGSWQAKPDPVNAEVHDDGRASKYEMLAGSQSVIDLHPCVPAEWITSPASALITEGVIKGDSALSAYLRHLGADESLLDSADVDQLRELLAAQPPDKRVLILSLVGVHNWRNNTEWVMLDVAGKPVWVAFDGDIHSNQQVWRAGSRLWEFLASSKKATPLLLDLGKVSTEQTGKVGIDDYLAKLGTWDDLPGLLSPQLPPAPIPELLDIAPGSWFFDDEARVTKSYEETDTGLKLTVERHYIGRVASVMKRRFVSSKELETGVLNPNASYRSVSAVIEVSWFDRFGDGRAHSAMVTGPPEILSTHPSDWARMKNVDVPPEIQRLDDWPPCSNRSDVNKWLAAAKRYRADETVNSVAWENMGWVPSSVDTSELPVFIVGEQVYGVDGLQEGDERKAVPGLAEAGLEVSEDFGVVWPDSASGAAEAITTVIGAYATAWKDRRITAAVLSTALRPIFPAPCQTPLVLFGPSRGGKSWTAATVMAFWGARPKVWTHKHLPGSAGDTKAAIEDAKARTLIWVADDLPPSLDAGTAAREEDKVGAALRNSFNFQSRGRMTSEMRRQQSLSPRAQFIVTTENDFSVFSVRDRFVGIDIRNALAGKQATDLIEALNADPSQPMPTTSGGVLQMYMDLIAQLGWGEARERILKTSNEVMGFAFDERARARKLDPGEGSMSRHRETCQELGMGLVLLHAASEHFECPVEVQDAILQLISDFADLVVESFLRQESTSPHRNLLQAIRSCLRANGVHVAASGDGGLPISASDRRAAELAGDFGADVTTERAIGILNQDLGWSLPAKGSKEAPRAGGKRIGVVVRRSGDPEAELVVLLDPYTALKEARSQFPGLVPAGIKEKEVFSAMWDEEGIVSHSWARRRPADYVVRVGSTRGVPIRLAALLDIEPVPEAAEATGSDE